MRSINRSELGLMFTYIRQFSHLSRGWALTIVPSSMVGPHWVLKSLAILANGDDPEWPMTYQLSLSPQKTIGPVGSPLGLLDVNQSGPEGSSFPKNGEVETERSAQEYRDGPLDREELCIPEARGINPTDLFAFFLEHSHFSTTKK